MYKAYPSLHPSWDETVFLPTQLFKRHSLTKSSSSSPSLSSSSWSDFEPVLGDFLTGWPSENCIKSSSSTWSPLDTDIDLEKWKWQVFWHFCSSWKFQRQIFLHFCSTLKRYIRKWKSEGTFFLFFTFFQIHFAFIHSHRINAAISLIN